MLYSRLGHLRARRGNKPGNTPEQRELGVHIPSLFASSGPVLDLMVLKSLLNRFSDSYWRFRDDKPEPSSDHAAHSKQPTEPRNPRPRSGGPSRDPPTPLSPGHPERVRMTMATHRQAVSQLCGEIWMGQTTDLVGRFVPGRCRLQVRRKRLTSAREKR